MSDPSRTSTARPQQRSDHTIRESAEGEFIGEKTASGGAPRFPAGVYSRIAMNQSRSLFLVPRGHLLRRFLPPFFALAALAACGGASVEESPRPQTRRPAAAPTDPQPHGFMRKSERVVYASTDTNPLSEVMHGTTVRENFRWLENPKDPKVQAWSDAQNVLTRSTLDGMTHRARLRPRIEKLLSGASADYLDVTSAGSSLFALKRQPPKQQAFLVALDAQFRPESARVLVDPNAMDGSGKTTIDWFVPSHDGKLVAVSISTGGSESGDVHVFDVASGKERVDDVVPHAQNGTGGGSLAWNAANNGFWYTRYPRGNERPKEDHQFYQQVYFHLLGTKTERDAYSLGKDFPKIAEVELKTDRDGRVVLVELANGDGGEFAHFVLPKIASTSAGDGKWVQVTRFSDQVSEGQLSRDGESLYLLSRAHGASRGEIVRVAPPTEALSGAKLVVKESEASVIERFVVTDHRLYINELLGGPSRLSYAESFPKAPRAGNDQHPSAGEPFSPVHFIEIPAISSIRALVPLAGDDVLVKNESYTSAPSFYRVDGKSDRLVKTSVAQTMPFDFDDSEVERVTCTSPDGTKVPLNLLKKKGLALDGSHPVLLTGYGGYSVNRVPRVRAMNRLWLDLGGVFAEANLRGGGEFGEEWHAAGKLTKKQNVFDDFAACAKWLVDQKFTTKDRLAIMGGSNGGLLMGASLVQHPEMFRAVIAMVGIYDMLRVELTPNGAFNVPEYGTVKDPDQFRALYKYSPYHNVVDGTKYPSVLFLTGANDPRVDPFHSRKMVARLQAASTSDRPILLRTSASTGHGMGTPLAAEIEENADIYAFLANELGMDVSALDAAK